MMELDPPERPAGSNGWHVWVETALRLILRRLDDFDRSCEMCRRDVGGTLEKAVTKLELRQERLEDRLRMNELRVASIVAIGVAISVAVQLLMRML